MVNVFGYRGVLCKSRSIGFTWHDDQLAPVGIPSYRSILDSVLRVAQRCKEARVLIQSQRSTPFTRASHQERYRICGAVQLLIDMSRAFDSIDRNQLFSRLHELGVRKEVVTLLTSGHSDTSYVIQTGASVTLVPVERGLRQGCKAAPWLWNSTLALILTDLAETIETSWLQHNTNLYADDIQAGDTFRSERELKQSQPCLQQSGIKGFSWNHDWRSEKSHGVSVFNILTSKCASRHNGVHFFEIWTSKSGPNP